ncbi:MAG TPA: NAD(P)-binding domain-containing protein [Candidatus Saccharimonadales bacterium]|nr:NAD(P)-binding domain-containing protein [Candidatus Saccharimonadales bacterium]
MSKNIGILGSGNVGRVLANGLRGKGYSVEIGNRTAHAVAGWSGRVDMLAEVAERADMIILAVKGSAAEAVVSELEECLVGKTVIDATNPIADSPPVDGVVSLFTGQGDSLMERIQEINPRIHLVKALNSVGSSNMIDPDYEGLRPSMFICGNDLKAKEEVSHILSDIGWEVEDMGSARSARAIEPLCILWLLRGYLSDQWKHAFKLLK